MVDETIVIEIVDKIDSSINKKIEAIAKQSEITYSAVEKLKNALASINVTAFDKLSATVARAQTTQQRLATEQQRGALIAQKLATEQQKTAQATANASINAQNLAASQQRAAVAATNAATSQQKLNNAQIQGQVAAQRLATEQIRVASTASNAQQRLLTEIQRTVTASNVAATAQQRLSTEVQKTALVTANAANAQQKLANTQAQSQAIAANLSNAQQRLNNTQAQGQIIAANLATAQQRTITAQQQTAVAAANAATAQQRINTAMTQSQIALANLATAQQRTNIAQTQGQIAAQNLATAQQRTAIATANAAAANSRAALSAFNLAQAQKTAASASQQALGNINLYAKGLAAIAAIAFPLKSVIDMMDAYTRLQNRLQLVSSSMEQTKQLSNELFKIAIKTRSPVEETAKAFARFDYALKNLGKSQKDSLRMTETVNKLLQLSGANAGETGAALLQLSQAFNKGKSDGDEFRNMMELMPRLAQAVADEMTKLKGKLITRGDLLKLAPKGEIKSGLMFDAIKSIEQEVDKAYSSMAMTVEQAMTNVRNSMIQGFGELNQQFKITDKITSALLWIAENLRTVAVLAISVVGPALVTMFNNATTAALRFAATNPLATAMRLVSIAVWGAIGALVVFSDKIVLVKESGATLQDAFSVAFKMMGEGFTNIGNDAESTAKKIKDEFSKTANESTLTLRKFTDTVAGFGAIVVGNFVGAFKAFPLALDMFVIMFEVAYKEIYNLTVSAVELFVNSWQAGFKAIGNIAKNAGLGDTFSNFLDVTEVKLPKYDTQNLKNELNLKAAQREAIIANEIAKYTTGSANLSNEFNKRVDQEAKKRQDNAAALAKYGDLLRPEGQAVVGSLEDSKGGKAAEKRAAALAKVNAELDNELQRMFMLKPEREAQQRFDQIQEQLIGKRIRLTQDEEAAIKKKIAAVAEAKDIQAAYDRIYEEVSSPLREYNATLAAANLLLDQGAINQNQFSGQVAKATELYKEASDPLYKYNEEIRKQLEVLKYSPAERETEARIMQITNELLRNGTVLRNEETNALRDSINALREKNAVAQQEASFYDASVGKRKTFIDQLQAIKNLRADPSSGFTQGDQDNAAMGMIKGMGLSTEGLDIETNAITANYQTMYEEIARMRNDNLIQEEDAARLRTQIWAQQQSSQLQAASNFFGTLAQLSKSNNKTLARIGKAAAITQAVINTYEGATKALAQGGFFGVAMAAAVVAAGMAQVAAIRSQDVGGYKSGGFTGNMPTNAVAGVVHGKEFVMNAAATSRIGVRNLEALQTGAASVQQNVANSPYFATPSGATSQTTNNTQTSSSPANIRIINTLDPSMLGDYLQTPEGEQEIVNLIRRNSDSVKQVVNG